MKLRSLVLIPLILNGCTTSGPPTPVQPFPSHDYWFLITDKTYEVGTSGTYITIPAGFVTDYASIPGPLWSIASPHSDYSEAATIHDYLYWTQSCSRLQADNIFLIAMKEDGVSDFKRWAVYRAVRGAGQRSWDENTQAVNSGLPRWIPEKHRVLTNKSYWPSLQKDLSAAGIRDAIPEKNQPYCALGDVTEVPSGVVSSMPTR